MRGQTWGPQGPPSLSFEIDRWAKSFMIHEGEKKPKNKQTEKVKMHMETIQI